VRLVTARYQKVATSSSSSVRRLPDEMLVAAVSKSPPAITETSEVAFNRETNWLPAGGMITRSACGNTMRRSASARVMPRAVAASC
jgi:hypothetical protein